MVRTNKGIFGPLSGTISTVIGGSCKGIAYLRSQPTIRKHTSTVDQLGHQLKFSLVINFVQIMTGLLHFTFKKYAVGMSQNNAAVAYNHKNAVTGKNLNYSIGELTVN